MSHENLKDDNSMTGLNKIGRRNFKRQGCWAIIMSLCSAMSLLMCAAFADLAERKLGVPSIFVYVLAGLGGVLVALLQMNADAEGASWRLIYGWMARILALLLIILNAYICVFIYVKSQGATLSANGVALGVIPPTPFWQVVTSMAIFIIICLLALFTLWRLVANMKRSVGA